MPTIVGYFEIGSTSMIGISNRRYLSPIIKGEVPDTKGKRSVLLTVALKTHSLLSLGKAARQDDMTEC